MSHRDDLDKKQREKMDNLLDQLPYFCRDYITEYCYGTLDRSTSTMLGYLYDIRTFFYFLQTTNSSIRDFSDITIEILDLIKPKDIQEYLFWLTNYQDANGNNVSNKAQGRARKVACLRSFFGYLFSEGLISSNPAKLVGTPKITRKSKPRLDKNEVSDLLDCSFTGDGLTDKQKPYAARTRLRDAAILSLFCGSGIRVSELVGLDLEDIDWKHKTIKVIRKGGDEDIVNIGDSLSSILYDYIHFERKTYDDSNHALFVSSRGKMERITVRSVERLVKKYGAATASNINITPHTLRRSFGTGLYRKENDIYLVQTALGHKDISVTSKFYVSSSEDQKDKIRNFSDDFIG